MSTPEVPEGPSDNNASMPRWLARIVALFFWVVGVPLVHAVLPWAISRLTPQYGWVEGRSSIWNLLGLVPVVIGTALLLWIMVLHLARTPERVTLERTPLYLLKRGPYAITRNPMYLAELALWFGWTILYGSLAIAIGLLIMWPAMNFVAIRREERNLEARFGEVYREYKRTVPRWLGKAGG